MHSCIPSFQHPLKSTTAILRFFRYPEEQKLCSYCIEDPSKTSRKCGITCNQQCYPTPIKSQKCGQVISSPHIKPNVLLFRFSVWRALLSSLSYVKKQTTTNYKQLLNSLAKINMFGKSNVKP